MKEVELLPLLVLVPKKELSMTGARVVPGPWMTTMVGTSRRKSPSSRRVVREAGHRKLWVVRAQGPQGIP
jgi:hypothetical protein